MVVVSKQLIDFLQFVVVGMLLTLIFDFFRSYRKNKKVTIKVLVIQDLIYFLVIAVLISVSIACLLDTSIRLYVFIAIICGSLIYLSVFSKYMTILYNMAFSLFSSSIYFFKLPIDIIRQFIQENCKFILKITKKCCKKFSHMLSLNCKKSKMNKGFLSPIFRLKNKKTKEVLLDDKKVQF